MGRSHDIESGKAANIYPRSLWRLQPIHPRRRTVFHVPLYMRRRPCGGRRGRRRRRSRRGQRAAAHPKTATPNHPRLHPRMQWMATPTRPTAHNGGQAHPQPWAEYRGSFLTVSCPTCNTAACPPTDRISSDHHLRSTGAPKFPPRTCPPKLDGYISFLYHKTAPTRMRSPQKEPALRGSKRQQEARQKIKLRSRV